MKTLIYSALAAAAGVALLGGSAFALALPRLPLAIAETRRPAPSNDATGVVGRTFWFASSTANLPAEQRNDAAARLYDGGCITCHAATPSDPDDSATARSGLGLILHSERTSNVE